MNEITLLFIVGAVVALFLFFKFWRFLLQIAVIGSLVIGGVYIYQHFQQSGRGGSKEYPRIGGSNKSYITSQSAIDKVKSYLASVSAKKYEQKKVSRRVRRRCRDYAPDIYKEECKKRYRTEVKYTYDTVWETKNVETHGTCKYPPRGGTWSASYNSSLQTWTVVNEGSERGRRFRWDVNGRTGQVSSHQPPC